MHEVLIQFAKILGLDDLAMLSQQENFVYRPKILTFTDEASSRANVAPSTGAVSLQIDSPFAQSSSGWASRVGKHVRARRIQAA